MTLIVDTAAIGGYSPHAAEGGVVRLGDDGVPRPPAVRRRPDAQHGLVPGSHATGADDPLPPARQDLLQDLQSSLHAGTISHPLTSPSPLFSLSFHQSPFEFSFSLSLSFLC